MPKTTTRTAMPSPTQAAAAAERARHLRAIKRLAATVPMLPEIATSPDPMYGWFLRPHLLKRPGESRPIEAFALLQISTPQQRAQAEEQGFIPITEASGHFSQNTLQIRPPSLEKCQRLARILLDRQEAYLEWLDDRIERAGALTEKQTGDPVGLVRDLQALRYACEHHQPDARELYAFFLEWHANMVGARENQGLQQALQLSEEAKRWRTLVEQAKAQPLS